jgi:SAM-dependent methyltransferase
MTDWYNEDLAYIHDVGFRDYALNSAPGILDILTERKIPKGLVVELGCGSGLLAEVLARSGYRVLGIDISPAILAIAQTRVPTAEFRVESLFSADIPPCGAVISVGECLNYMFVDNSDRVLEDLFARIYHALLPGGVFIFDVVIPGQIPPEEIVKSFTEGSDWIVLVAKEEDLTEEILTRRIITLRQVNEYYRRTEEVHHQRLFQPAKLTQILSKIGFQVDTSPSYRKFNLPVARLAFVTQKPIAITS